MMKKLLARCSCCGDDEGTERAPLVNNAAPVARQPASVPAAGAPIDRSKPRSVPAKWDGSTFQARLPPIEEWMHAPVSLAKCDVHAPTVAVVGPAKSGKSYVMLGSTPPASGPPLHPAFRRASGLAVRFGGAPNAAWLRAASSSDPVCEVLLHQFGDSVVIVARSCKEAVELAARAESLICNHARVCVVHNYVAKRLPTSVTDKPVAEAKAAFPNQQLNPWYFHDDTASSDAAPAQGDSRFVGLRSSEEKWTHVFLVGPPSSPSPKPDAQSGDPHNFVANAPVFRAIQRIVGRATPVRVDRDLARAINGTICTAADAALSVHEDAACEQLASESVTTRDREPATTATTDTNDAPCPPLPRRESGEIVVDDGIRRNSTPHSAREGDDEPSRADATSPSHTEPLTIPSELEFFQLHRDGGLVPVDAAWELLASALPTLRETGDSDRRSRLHLLLAAARGQPGAAACSSLTRQVSVRWSIEDRASPGADGVSDDLSTAAARDTDDAAVSDVGTTLADPAYTCSFTMEGLECPQRRALVEAQLKWDRGIRLDSRHTVELHVRGPQRQLLAKNTIVELSHVGGEKKDPQIRFESPGTVHVMFPSGDIHYEPDEEGQLHC